MKDLQVSIHLFDIYIFESATKISKHVNQLFTTCSVAVHRSSACSQHVNLVSDCPGEDCNMYSMGE